MLYEFLETPDAVMASCLECLRLAHAGGGRAGQNLRLALVDLVGLCDRQARVGPVDPERLRRFRSEATDAMAHLDRQIAAFILDVAMRVDHEARELDDWYEICMRRSVLQLLLDDYPQTPALAMVDATDMIGFDDHTRETGRAHGPIPEALIPMGLPDTHWWWRYPRPG
ncbi:MAG TPA: hypothetical protein VKQ32_04055 [Polyangia bacterium]|nr:hypothetical protein [Polyangia bacterium]